MIKTIVEILVTIGFATLCLVGMWHDVIMVDTDEKVKSK